MADRRTARGRKARARGEMLQRAAELFRAKGFDRSTMEDVARELGLLKGSLYYYFDSKQEILDEILVAPRRFLLDQLESIATSNATADEKLRQAITEFVTTFDIEYPAMSVAVYERFDRSVEQRDNIRLLRRRIQEIFEQIVRQGVDEGRFKAVSPKMATFAITGMCNWLSTWYEKGGPFTSRQIAENFADLVLNGLRTADNPPSTQPAQHLRH